MKSKTIILLYSTILLTAMLIQFSLDYFKPFNIVPTHIPYTSIPINGTILLGIFLIILISAQKKILKNQPETTLLTLFFLGSIIIIVCESIFQLVRLMTFDLETFFQYSFQYINVLMKSSLFGIMLAFLTAFQLKTKKTGILILLIIGFILLLKLMTYIR